MSSEVECMLHVCVAWSRGLSLMFMNLLALLNVMLLFYSAVMFVRCLEEVCEMFV